MPDFMLGFLKIHTLQFKLLIASFGLTLLVMGSTLVEGSLSRFLTGLGGAATVASIVSILFTASTEQAVNDFRKEAVIDLCKEVSAAVAYVGADVKDYVRAIQKSMYSVRVSRTVFNMGVTDVRFGGLVDDDFLKSQRSLDIFIKDGHTFFEKRNDVIRSRMCDQTKSTRIIIVHPDYQFMEAVANMDDHKENKPDIQRADCLKVIRTLQEISKVALKSGIDIRKTTEFFGIKMVPTWNGFLGDDRGFAYFYYTRAYRGDLLRLSFDDIGEGALYCNLKREIDELLRDHCRGRWNLWEYSEAV
jgi:hypothetical protein